MILCFFEWVARVFPHFIDPEVSGYKRPVSQNPAPPMCDHYLPKLLAAIRSVEKEELWLREGENLNSIGGIALHLCEHVRRNALYLGEGDASISRGIEEHFPHLPLSPEELAARAEQAFGEWRRAMEARLCKTGSGCHPEKGESGRRDAPGLSPGGAYRRSPGTDRRPGEAPRRPLLRVRSGRTERAAAAGEDSIGA
ncbi:hypothetical protein CLV97_12746 [Planifilum fimeticola]|jgi:hypothetical protein|uniref:DinB family protein n=1 Tax=Planifilum fimeticola TaxID=201975 RepID=A0A2T0LBG7_9BACL|nr:hypothetical protein [Planifilum fimeticola]PRX39263.1 hypothetical protein CLV97_12746 [Planifilum fimeticola]